MDLSTQYLGLNLRTPLVPSASPLSEDVDNLKRMEDAGAAAVVLPSLFEEQIRQERNTLLANLTRGTESYPEALSLFSRTAVVSLRSPSFISTSSATRRNICASPSSRA